MLLLTKYSIVNFAAFPWVYKKKNWITIAML